MSLHPWEALSQHINNSWGGTFIEESGSILNCLFCVDDIEVKITRCRIGGSHKPPPGFYYCFKSKKKKFPLSTMIISDLKYKYWASDMSKVIADGFSSNDIHVYTDVSIDILLKFLTEDIKDNIRQMAKWKFRYFTIRQSDRGAVAFGTVEIPSVSEFDNFINFGLSLYKNFENNTKESRVRCHPT